MSKRRREQQRPVRQVQQEHRLTFERRTETSPFPHPETLAKLKEVDPKLLDVLMDNVRLEQQHRHQHESAVLDAQAAGMRLEHEQRMLALRQNELAFARDKRQQWMSFGLLACLVVGGSVLFGMGKNWAAVGNIAAAVIAFVNLFKKDAK